MHDKAKNSTISNRTLQNVGVTKNFYSPRVEYYLNKIETKVGKQFKKIRSINRITSVNLIPIFRYLMSQLVRTPKFREKLRKDQIFLMQMDEIEFKESLMHKMLVSKPKDVTESYLQKIQEDFILYNLLETTYKWPIITLITNLTQIPFITSDCPVVYNNAEFLPSYLHEKDLFAYSIITALETRFYFPIHPKFSLMIDRFGTEKKEIILLEEYVSNEKLIMLINSMEYQYSGRFVYLRDPDNKLIQEIRKICSNKINVEYQTMEYSYSVLKSEIKEASKILEK